MPCGLPRPQTDLREVVRAERGLELLDSGPVASIFSAIVLAAISERSVVYYTSE